MNHKVSFKKYQNSSYCSSAEFSRNQFEGVKHNDLYMHQEILP